MWDTGNSSPDQQLTYAKMPAVTFLRLAEKGLASAVVIPAPEEEDFYAALTFPFWPPEQRTMERLQKYLRGLKVR